MVDSLIGTRLEDLDSMNPADREELYKRARIEESEKAIRVRFTQIFRKGHALTSDDIAFLRARQSYLSPADKTEYAKELKQVSALQELTRKELEAKAEELGIENPQDYANKEALIAAIEDAQK